MTPCGWTGLAQRKGIAKTWYANDVFMPVWMPIIQLVNVVLLGKQKPLEVTWAFLYILKNKVGPADEDENLDWATYFKEKIREEIRASKKQMQASGKRKVKPVCIGIVVLHIFRTCSIVDDEDIVLSDSDKSVEEVTPPRLARAPQVHVLSSSTSPDPSSSNPERVQVSPGRRKQASPTSPDRQHSPESSPGAPSTLSDHATRSGSSTSPDREETVSFDNEPLGFGSPMVPYPSEDDDEEVTVAGLISLGASDPSTSSKGKRPVEHRSSSESKEIRFVMPDRVKRRVADPDDEADGLVSQQAEG
ncbi:hypothetical protein R1sor_016810 [Riccia sorocarpa]|uniref:Uncharacterized protein n=1 Tax=Riccia sorocarpa TaxID=122646 RepID=A0ABD3HI22_9MARC